jgi:hypothetical protein
MVYYTVEHMSKTSSEVSQSQDETLGTDHLGSVESNGTETQGNNPPAGKSASKPNKFIVELTVIDEPKVNDEVTPPITKYHLQQQTIAYFTINGQEVPTVQTRSLWMKVSGDNPLELEEGDTFELDKRDTRLTKSTWLANPDDPDDNTMHYTHWVNPKVFTMPENHVLAEW